MGLCDAELRVADKSRLALGGLAALLAEETRKPRLRQAGPPESLEGLLVHLLEANHVRLCPQHLLQLQLLPVVPVQVLWEHVPEEFRLFTRVYANLALKDLMPELEHV